jgi:molecular chaperone DnaK
LPKNLPKGSPVEVKCSVGSNGLVDVRAMDLTSGKAARAEIHRATGLTDDEIAREAEWVRSLDIQ